MEKSFLQQQAELSKFDGSREERIDSRVEAVIPHATKEYYDPSHVDADWSGHVERRYTKKIFQQQATSKLSFNNGGIIPTEQEKKTGGKKLYSNDIKFKSIDAGAANAPLNSAVSQLGPGEAHDCTNWKTSYSAQTATTPDQGNNKPQPSYRKRITPLYAQSQPTARAKPTKQTVRAGNQSSLLAGIGKNLAGSISIPISSSAPRGFQDSNSKELLAENFNTFGHHGYSGRRKL